MLDLSWIDKDLAIGPAIEADDIKHLHDLGIDCIVDLRSERADDEVLVSELGMEFLRVPFDDATAPTFEQAKRLLDWIDERPGKKIYVHCQNGSGRSPIIAMAYLIRKGMRADEALERVKETRPTAGPNTCQLDFLNDFEQKLKGKR